MSAAIDEGMDEATSVETLLDRYCVYLLRCCNLFFKNRNMERFLSLDIWEWEKPPSED
jgi:hypothetical protein